MPTTRTSELRKVLAGPQRDRTLLFNHEHHEPHRLLGAHAATADGVKGVVVRGYHPEAVRADCVIAGRPQRMKRIGRKGLFALFVPAAKPPLAYQLSFHFRDRNTWDRDDPYRFLPTLGDVDLHLLNEGTHRRLWEALGAHARCVDGVLGASFAVWAPNAKRVSVVGDFCRWDGRLLPMRALGSSGVFELFVPGVESGAHYKYEIKTQTGEIRLKCDPMGAWMEHPPGTASRVFQSAFEWSDAAWMSSRAARDTTREPLAVYELHLGSWMWDKDGRPLSYRELAPRLVEHVKRFGFTHVEPMPPMEHPYTLSWGYQISGYYAPTSRFGDPDDFRFFVDFCHAHDVGVIIDWVPAHFPKDDFALARFDGTALYEHADPRRGEHPDWGTLVFNYGRNEVRNFLVANAVYWLNEFHVDGLRVDAVASMLYLDYSRKEGEWLPNRYGGRENLEAIDFVQTLNATVRREAPGALMIAEESTAWGGVTRPVEEGGLGFTYKWNMGWMNDTLMYFSKDAIHRRYHHNELTFAMVYEYTERFLMPLSHDEIVHGKQSLLEKMPGDLWQKFANLRTLLAYQYTRPGKKLLFMGTELAPWYEWNCEHPLDWSLANYPERAALQRFLETLGSVYRETPPLWRSDPDPACCAWIDCHDSDNSVVSFYRRDGDDYVVVVMNLTPVPRENYRIGVPTRGCFRMLLNTDDESFGGSGSATEPQVDAEGTPWHGFEHSINLRLPPLALLALRCK